MVRGDVGGFRAGSDFSWQVLAAYNFQLCVTNRYVLDAYFGYRALSVDYSQGSGDTKYEYNVLQQGPSWVQPCGSDLLMRSAYPSAGIVTLICMARSGCERPRFHAAMGCALLEASTLVRHTLRQVLS